MCSQIPFGQTKNGLASGRLGCTSSKTEILNYNNPWFHSLLKTYTIVCATVDSQCLEYMGCITLPFPHFQDTHDEAYHSADSHTVFWLSAFYSIAPLTIMVISYSMICYKVRESNLSLELKRIRTFNKHQNEVHLWQWCNLWCTLGLSSRCTLGCRKLKILYFVEASILQIWLAMW